VTTVTLLALAVALVVDVTNQLAFFVDWSTCLRSWTITAVVSAGVAMPITRVIAKAHLELYRAKQIADQLGRTDSLTGLLNRRAFIEAALARKPELLALVIFDIDCFKRVNDTYGHLTGDVVIQTIARMMTAEFAGFGPVARMGGEEFALLSDDGSPDRLARQLVAFCTRVGATPVVVNGQSLRVTLSAGLAVGEGMDSFERLYAEADRALYAAKRAGRNRVHFPPTIEASLTIAAKPAPQEKLPRSA